MPERSAAKLVLVAGATGALGRKVVAHLRLRGHRVRALVRPGSDASAIEGDGVEIARGDLMDPGSLALALRGVDAVITTAAGYTGRRKTDTSDIDTIGNRNLVDAAATTGVPRFVLTSILTAEQTPDVPHFWHKKLVEDHLDARGVPYVSLRPGAFLDQSTDFVADSVTKGRLLAIGGADYALTMVYTEDLARYLAAAVDLPEEANGAHVDIGWDRPLSWRALAETLGELRGRPLALWTVPWWLLVPLLGLVGLFSPAVRDIAAMLRHFRTGRYVADTALQARYFDVPTAEDVLGRWMDARGLGRVAPGHPVPTRS